MIANTDTQQKLDFCGQVIDAYTARRRESRSSTETLLREVILCWEDLKNEQDGKNKAFGHLFNPLASIPIGETTHSSILGDLLDPKGSHGQGRLLLEAFLERLGVPTPATGDWMISMGQVDICLWRSSPESVVIIENKSNGATDQPNQLYRYWYQEIHKRYPQLDYSLTRNRLAFQIIYLPPFVGYRPAEHSFECPEYLDGERLPKTLADVGVAVKVLTFRHDITEWLDDCVQLIPPTNVRLKVYLEFYNELWS